MCVRTPSWAVIRMPRPNRMVPLNPVNAFQKTHAGAVILDIRPPWTFSTGHPAGAINIMFSRDELAYRVPQVLQKGAPVILLSENENETKIAQHVLQRSAGMDVLGFIEGGFAAWAKAGLPVAHIDEMTIHDLRAKLQLGDDIVVVDVRDDQEWQSGHIPRSHHIPLNELLAQTDRVPRDRPVALICAAGNRSSTAASVLQRQGMEKVYNVLEGTAGWQHAGYAVETAEDSAA